MSTGDNKALVRRYFEEIHNGRNAALSDEIFSPNLAGPARDAAAMFQVAFPDYRITIIEQVAEGDRVATVWSASGTQQGVWPSPMGHIEPTGKPVTFTGTTTLRVRGGKITEVIGTNHDHLGILQQLGVVPATAPRPGA